MSEPIVRCGACGAPLQPPHADCLRCRLEALERRVGAIHEAIVDEDIRRVKAKIETHVEPAPPGSRPLRTVADEKLERAEVDIQDLAEKLLSLESRVDAFVDAEAEKIDKDAEINGLKQDCIRLEMRAAGAEALGISHEGRIARQDAEIARLKADYGTVLEDNQRLREENKDLREMTDDRWWKEKEKAEAEVARLSQEAARFDEWRPVVESVNALPEGIRRYIHDLETRCDPAGEVRELVLARDEIKMRDAEITRLKDLARIRDAELDKISKHPDVADRAGVGDGSVSDAVIAVCGALASAHAEIARLLEETESLRRAKRTVLAQRDTAWDELNDIRKVVNARDEEATSDEVRSEVARLKDLLSRAWQIAWTAQFEAEVRAALEEKP